MTRTGRVGAAMSMGAIAWFASSFSGPDLGAQVRARIVLDGRFDDWAAYSPALIDPADAPASPVDFKEVRVAADGVFVYVLIDFGRPVAAQGLDGTATMLFDADGNSRTGRTESGLPGVDVMVDFSPPAPDSPTLPGRGVGVRWTTCESTSTDVTACRSSPYDLDIVLAPSYASQRLELRIRRGGRAPDGLSLFGSDRFAAKLTFVDRRGQLLDETAPFQSALTEAIAADLRVDPPHDPLARALNTAFRVLTWNVSRRSIQEHPDAFGRILSAIKPDIILLDEVTDESSARRLQQFLSGLRLPGKSWQVVFGAGGGTQRSTVSSWHRVAPVARMAHVLYPEDSVRTLMNTVDDPKTRSALLTEVQSGVGTVGAWVDVGVRRLLMVSLDLMCCGPPDGPEDRLRQIELEAIHAAVRAARASASFDGLVIGGDFNLVGRYELLDTMTRDLDVNDAPLAVEEALQLDGRSNVTWADPKQAFVPGRLDYILYSGSTLAVNRAFVFDSKVLSPRWLRHHGMRAEDSETASDHMPVVADVRWVGRPRGR